MNTNEDLGDQFQRKEGPLHVNQSRKVWVVSAMPRVTAALKARS